MKNSSLDPVLQTPLPSSNHPQVTSPLLSVPETWKCDHRRFHKHETLFCRQHTDLCLITPLKSQCLNFILLYSFK